ncbi:molybdenum cofactor biosynthesis protein MoaE [Thermococcus sp. P6]|uniref:molybdenum cofactor biosynthesis protein MoaE n=1 Tax=Thermococcus sp. P6 TaxID=122420 RepID=UPI000B59D99A|nr:molybdenum cofactor biosynthesis protein MoaE [Thermococcus sp. P6]ASJ10629.1 molybdenum cofactor biosynthesis protein MoaE [Thermococcus sp. P6]
MKVRITKEAFDLGEALGYLSVPEAGGYVIFLGRVRNENRGRRVKKLVYEAYPEMALGEMERIREEALKRFPILDILIWHRYGELEVGQDTMLIIASGRHRKEAFDACMWAVEEVKHRVPIWKKEVTDEGTFWIEGDRLIPGE